ncbi:MAG: hypothetical protein RI897_4653 [Verrucomicrobiota bacterium]
MIIEGAGRTSIEHFDHDDLADAGVLAVGSVAAGIVSAAA